MNVAEAKERLDAIGAELPTHRAHAEQLAAVRSVLAQKIRDAGRPSTTFDHVNLERLHAALHMVEEDGIRYADGVLPELESLTTGVDWSSMETALPSHIAVPGIRATADTIARLEAEREELRAYLAPWSGSTTRPFRYVGPQYKHRHGDRYVEPGEVISLTDDQAHSFRDRFEPVSC